MARDDVTMGGLTLWRDARLAELAATEMNREIAELVQDRTYTF